MLAALEITPSNPEHGDEVKLTKSSASGASRAVFLMKVKEYDSSGLFTAKYVSPEKAARHVAKQI